MSTTISRRIVVIGTGTGVGKTWLSCELLRALRAQGRRVLGLKPIESGVSDEAPTDGGLLADAALGDPERARALEIAAPYRLLEPISPHLAARRSGRSINVELALTYVQDCESAPLPGGPVEVSLVETAGGLFSPLDQNATNWDFARALDPSRWLLVAPDALGVLHDLTATLLAAGARGRAPDAIALCCARPQDASTGTNAAEVERLGVARRPFVFPDDGSAGIEALLANLLE
jgi:dethiobiotin synthetase